MKMKRMKHDQKRFFENFPLTQKMAEYREVFWENDKYGSGISLATSPSEEKIVEASERLGRFAPYIQEVFPETGAHNGIIESPLIAIDNMKAEMNDRFGIEIDAPVYIKADDRLTVSGSVKARGGIYEVLNHAEDLAEAHGMIDPAVDYRQFATEGFHSFFSDYTIICGSTGNLGLSIGIMSARLGFKVVIHMSSDAKQWKKDMLRDRGVTVMEHEDDYSRAVEAGREAALSDEKSYFVDDEDSEPLFLGYAVAALRLKGQLDEKGIHVDGDHPLFVHLPCGVGSAPGGISFGLKHVFGEHVHPVFAEPTHSPAMLLGLMTGLHDEISVRDIGLDNRTIADGLAVGRPSKFVGQLMENRIHSLYTVDDDALYEMLAMLHDRENMKLEPSALAGMPGPWKIHGNLDEEVLSGATHIVWSTGGDMVPDEEWQKDYQKGLK